MVNYYSERILNTGERLDYSLIATMNELAKSGCKHFLIDAGMSTGKTYLLVKEVALQADAIDKRVKKQTEWAKDSNRRILILSNRIALIEQIVQQYGIDSDKMIIDVRSYQDIEKGILKNEDLSIYPVIIADEAHYFFSDSDFSKYTELSIKYLLKSGTVNRVIFMTATPTVLISYLNTYYSDVDVAAFKVKKAFNVRCLHYYRNNLTKDIITDIWDSSHGKFILFRNNKDDNKDLKKVLKEKGIIAHVIESKSKKKDYNSEERKTIEYIVAEQKLPKEAAGLITTSVLDNGINIYDSEVKSIIIEDYLDIVSAVQCIGRKRLSEATEEKIDLYVKIPSKKKLIDRKHECKSNIDVANQYIHNPKELFKAIGREDSNYEVLYYDLDGEVRLNDVALHKVKHDYNFLCNCLDDDNYYITELVSQLGYNINKTEDLEITSVHNELVQALKPFLSTEDKTIKMFRDLDCDYSRKDFIRVINQYLKGKEKLIEDCKITTVNKLFQKYSIPYEVESCKELSKPNRNKNYWVLRKIQ